MAVSVLMSWSSEVYSLISMKSLTRLPMTLSPSPGFKYQSPESRRNFYCRFIPSEVAVL